MCGLTTPIQSILPSIPATMTSHQCQTQRLLTSRSPTRYLIMTPVPQTAFFFKGDINATGANNGPRVICKESPDKMQKPCFPIGETKCKLVGKSAHSTCLGSDDKHNTICYPVAYCNDVGPTRPWAEQYLAPPKDLVLETMPSANLLGFGSPSDYEFGLFQVMSCPKDSAGGGALEGISRMLQCRYYYALYAAGRGTSMNECGLLGRGKVGDPHVWVDASMNISSFDPTAKDWQPSTPDYAPLYAGFLTRPTIAIHARRIVSGPG